MNGILPTALSGVRLLARPIVLFSLLFGIASVNQAQTDYLWVGAVSGAWDEPLNWSPNGIPINLDAVQIQAAPNVVQLSGSRAITGFTLSSGELNLGSFTLTVTGSGSYTGGSIINGTLVLNAPAAAHLFNGALIGCSLSGTAASIVFGGSTFQQAVQLTRTGAANDVCYGTNVFQQSVSLTSAGSGTWSLANTGATQFQGGLQLASSAAGGIQFGASGGATTLPAGQMISIAPAGFTAGQLQFRNFNQVGATPQALTLTGTSSISFQSGSTWHGALTVAAPRIFLSGGTYHAASSFMKTGAGTDNGSGGCTFHGPVALAVTSTGFLQPAAIGSDTYNAGLTVSSTSTGGIAFGTVSGTTILAAGQTISVGGAGFNNGLLQLSRFNQIGATAQVLSLGTSATVSFVGPNTFSGPVDASAGNVLVSGSTFHGACTFTKTGTGTNASAGGNTFNGPATFKLTGSGEFQPNATGVDVFNNSLSFGSTGSGTIRFGASTGSAVLSAGQVLGIAPMGFASGTLALRNFTQSSATAQALTINGTATLLIGPSVVFNGALSVEAPSLFFNGGVFHGPVQGIKSGASVDACTGGNTFNAQAEFTVTGAGALWLNNTGVDAFNGDFRVNCLGGGGIHFGMSGGTATLAAGRTIATGALGFNSGMLTMRNFQQLGGTPQSITLTGTAGVRFDLGTAFNGNVVTHSAALMLDGATFNGSFDGTRTGLAANTCRGGNVFNGSFRLRMSGSGHYYMANLLPDQFNGPAWFQRLGSGQLHVAYSFDARFANDVSMLGTVSPVSFGANGGTVEIIGGGVREWNSTVSFPFNLPRLRVNGASGICRLNADVSVSESLVLVQGVLQPMAATSMSPGLLIVGATCSVSDPASNSAYTDGWVRKVGAAPFQFPLGHGNTYAPLQISAPMDTTHHFTARYRRIDPDPQWSTSLKDITLDHLSRCEYWELERTGGNSAVTVTLSWDTHRSCVVNAIPDLRIARSDGALWRDHGNGGTMGTNVTGTVVSATPLSVFGPFTLASATAMNPLPVELLWFEAREEGSIVRLAWATVSESGSEAFEVERSVDGVLYGRVARDAAAGYSSSLLDYGAIDERPLLGRSFYRLRMIDADGSEKYSEVRVLERSPSAPIVVFPNPARDFIWLLMDTDGAEQAELFDMTGVSVGMLALSTEDGRVQCDISRIGAGMYQLRLIRPGLPPATVRFVKQ